MSAAIEAAELLEELVGVDLMPHEFHDRASRIAGALREQASDAAQQDEDIALTDRIKKEKNHG